MQVPGCDAERLGQVEVMARRRSFSTPVPKSQGGVTGFTKQAPMKRGPGPTLVATCLGGGGSSVVAVFRKVLIPQARREGI
jgi:hypothetical protein